MYKKYFINELTNSNNSSNYEFELTCKKVVRNSLPRRYWNFVTKQYLKDAKLKIPVF